MKAAKVDATQAEIVAALRKAGATVQSLATVGNGCPDLLVGYNNKTVLMEIKDGKKSPSQRMLNGDQLEWHRKWRGGMLSVVDSVEAAFRVLGMLS